MQFYLAPMEGITGQVYRNVYHLFFDNIDKYMTPFISPNKNRTMKTRELKDVAPENNQGINTVPQILTNKADYFIKTCEDLRKLGYKEVNLNLGCPSPTVVTKGKGSGFLAEPKELSAFFDAVFANTDMKISVKTRIGVESVTEWEDIMEVYNRFPFEELIVHPRVQQDFYKNTPNLEAFAYAVEHSKAPVCYNGDIFNVEQYEAFTKQFQTVDRIMLGRGVIANPALIAQIKGEGMITKELLKSYHDKLLKAYHEDLSSDRDTLFKMKELWFYLGFMFADCDKMIKKVKKAIKMTEYETAVNRLFDQCALKDNAGMFSR